MHRTAVAALHALRHLRIVAAWQRPFRPLPTLPSPDATPTPLTPRSKRIILYLLIEFARVGYQLSTSYRMSAKGEWG